MSNPDAIAALKAQARQHRLEYLRLTSGFDCGAHLAEYIKPESEKHRLLFEAAIDKLRQLDPHFPKVKP